MTIKKDTILKMDQLLNSGSKQLLKELQSQGLKLKEDQKDPGYYNLYFDPALNINDIIYLRVFKNLQKYYYTITNQATIGGSEKTDLSYTGFKPNHLIDTIVIKGGLYDS